MLSLLIFPSFPAHQFHVTAERTRVSTVDDRRVVEISVALFIYMLVSLHFAVLLLLTQSSSVGTAICEIQKLDMSHDSDEKVKSHKGSSKVKYPDFVIVL